MRSLWRLALAGALAFTFGIRSASADTFTSFLTVPNTEISGAGVGPQVFGTVTVTTTGTNTADVTFQAAAGFSFIDSSVADVQVNAGSWTLSHLSTNGSGATLVDGGSGNVDGFGVFNQTFNQGAGFGSAASTISFTLTDTSGTFANAASVLTTNGSGFDAAAHIAVNNTGGAVTGFVAESPTSIPEPGPLLGTGVVTLLGLGYTWLRRRRATA